MFQVHAHIGKWKSARHVLMDEVRRAMRKEPHNLARTVNLMDNIGHSTGYHEWPFPDIFFILFKNKQCPHHIS